MRIAILGVGDYGSRFAVRLIEAGEDVTLIARGATLERLKAEGLTANVGPTTPEMHVKDVNATNETSSVGPVDILMICVKLYQLDDAMELASPLVGENTTVLGFQNGVTSGDRLSRRFGAERVLGVSTSEPVAIGELPQGTSERTSAIVQMFNGIEVVAIEHENVMESIWGKFLMTCGGSVTALSRLSIGEIVKVPELMELGRMAVAEAIGLANAKGLSFSKKEGIVKFDKLIDRVSVSNPGWRPSLLQDLDAGRPLELDAWCGGAVKIGQELGIPTPVNFAMYAGLKSFEEGVPVMPK